MSDRPLLSTAREGNVLVATMSRPPVNALDAGLLDALDAALDSACADESITVLHLRSGQKAFCAGADLALMDDCLAASDGVARMIAHVQRMQAVFARLESAPVVTLAEIAGAAIGGGLELALACDLRIAAAEAKLGLTEARLGLLPGAGGTQRLTRLCGPGIARRLILGAEMIDGAEALRLGVVQWATPRAALTAKAREMAAACAALPRSALSASKRCVAAAGDPAHDGYALEIEQTERLYGDPETRRRVAEFLGKRAG